VTRPIDLVPTNDAQLFDMLHGLFGIGDYADESKTPWHRVKITETSKIKAIRKRRNYSIEDFAMLARHCARRGAPIGRVWDLLKYWPEASREHRLWLRQEIDRRIEAAVAVERARPDASEEWVDRLLLASGPGRELVLDEWTRKRSNNDERDPRRLRGVKTR
jgi:hypothetical protein